MAIEIIRYKAMDEAKRSSAKKLETRRSMFAGAAKKAPSKPAARKPTK
jgi:hypothetical protein